MRGNPERVLIPVPEHVTHGGPEDGSECSICQFYRTGYWTAVDSMLEDSNRQYDAGQRWGVYVAKRDMADTVLRVTTYIILALLVSAMVRGIVEQQRAERPASG